MKSKIIGFFQKIHTICKPYEKNLIFPILKIIGIIILCAFIAHLMSGNETLSDYAAKNPDIAYGVETEIDK